MLFLQIFLLLVAANCSAGDIRAKRVLQGLRVLGRKGPYDAVRYLVGIGSVHGTHWYTFGFHRALVKYGIHGHIGCGGALLTPSIVQTACHCVASFAVSSSPSRASVRDHWEGVKVVYIGVNDRFGRPWSMETTPPVKSVKFFVHNLCERLPQDKTQAPITHDFGYIKIDPTWIKGTMRVPTNNVQFAPSYLTAELTRIYDHFMETPPVCLNLGFGVYSEDNTISDFIRAGWAMLADDWRCEIYTCRNLTEADVEKYKSWVCAEEFPVHYQPIRDGDSGGPFTCNNAYFGVVSGSVPLTRKPKGQPPRNIYVGTHGALTFAVYQNAYEHRRAFQAEVDKMMISTDTYAEAVRKFFKRVVDRKLASSRQNASFTGAERSDGAGLTSSSINKVPSAPSVFPLITLLIMILTR